MKTLILGIGNVLLRDEGFGVHAMRKLQTLIGDMPDVELVDGGTLSFSLCPRIEAADALLVLDAANLNEAPGTLRCFEGDALDAFLCEHTTKSVHEVALRDLITIAALGERLPPRRALVAVQPECIDWGDTPGQRVADATPAACDAALRILAAWKAGSPPRASAIRTSALSSERSDTEGGGAPAFAASLSEVAR